jgi:RNA polymerase sigma-70 factor (ECF subfamily)
MKKQGAYEGYYADDLALWRAFLHGDAKAFSIIYDRHFEVLYAYGLKIVKDGQLVEDMIHDLFVMLWERRQTLGHTHAIKFYLFTCLKRELVKKARNEQKNFSWDASTQ